MLKEISACCAAALIASTAYADGLDIDQIAGVYIQHFRNADISGDKFWSDDVLEIVKVSPRAAYFWTHLEFFNAHQCNLSGVAEISGQSLVYRDPDQQCELRLNIANGKIIFDDKGDHCREQSCGARGGYSSTTFELKARRPISYMQKLLASSEYRDALKAHHASQEQ